MPVTASAALVLVGEAAPLGGEPEVARAAPPVTAVAEDTPLLPEKKPVAAAPSPPKPIDPSLVTPGGLVLAQAAGDTEGASPQARYQAAFDAMLADLDDPERSFAFVEAAIAVGDVRGAISTLERILLLNPTLGNIKLELANLYQRVGNDALARTYYRQALTSPDIPDDVRARTEALLAESEEALDRHRVQTTVYGAVRYETNANRDWRPRRTARRSPI